MTGTATKERSAPPAPDAVREEIVRHAVDLFGHYGYRKTHIGDIAERCGMSPANLYRYFRNKQAIGEEAVRRYMAAAETEMGAVLLDPGADWEAKLRRMVALGVGGLVRELRHNPKIVELADMICESDSGILARHIDWKRAQFEALIREGAAAGALDVADPSAMARTLLDATKAFWMPMALVQIDLDEAADRVEAVLDLAIRGMRFKARGS